MLCSQRISESCRVITVLQVITLVTACGVTQCGQTDHLSSLAVLRPCRLPMHHMNSCIKTGQRSVHCAFSIKQTASGSSVHVPCLMTGFQMQFSVFNRLYSIIMSCSAEQSNCLHTCKCYLISNRLILHTQSCRHNLCQCLCARQRCRLNVRHERLISSN